jgi:hypothetical protein
MYVNAGVNTYMTAKALIFDQTGKLLSQSYLSPGLNKIFIKPLIAGNDIIRLQQADRQIHIQQIVKQ